MVESIHPNRADEIVSALLVADRNEIIGLLESPSSLEAAVVIVLPKLPLPKRGLFSAHFQASIVPLLGR
jgi:hypothetical protein